MLNIDLSVSRFFDEMLLAEGQHRGHYDAYRQWLQPADQLTIARKREGLRLFHIYPQGNFIEATQDTPYFQIGESKYGKPIIDRVLNYDTTLDQAMQCALISMDSTLRSNLSVGLPLDVMIYPLDSFRSEQQYRITEDHPYFMMIRKGWGEGLVSIFAQFPALKLGE